MLIKSPAKSNPFYFRSFNSYRATSKLHLYTHTLHTHTHVISIHIYNLFMALNEVK